MTSPAGRARRPRDPVTGHPSFVYVLCLGEPRPLGSTDLPDFPTGGTGRCAPVTHYVGYTQQDRPMNRAGGHAGAGMITCVLLQPGTRDDEEILKRRGRCPRCGQSLNYRREARAFARAARALASPAPGQGSAPR